MRIYVQVCYRLAGESTQKREVASLQKAADNFPKYIVTLDDFGLGTTSEGIQVVHLREFLLKILYPWIVHKILSKILKSLFK